MGGGFERDDTTRPVFALPGGWTRSRPTAVLRYYARRKATNRGDEAVRKSLKKKLTLNRETLRALATRPLCEVVGGIKTAHTCGDPCTTTCAPPTA
jgi:hypothetical protein